MVLRRVSRILNKEGLHFANLFLYFRVEAHFNRSKITLHLESSLKSTPSKLNGFWQAEDPPSPQKKKCRIAAPSTVYKVSNNLKPCAKKKVDTMLDDVSEGGSGNDQA